MNKLIKIIGLILIGFLGLLIGGIIGFYGVYYFCLLHDYSTSAEPGGGLISVGWVFTFYTVPIGAIFGAIVSIIIYRKVLKRFFNR